MTPCDLFETLLADVNGHHRQLRDRIQQLLQLTRQSSPDPLPDDWLVRLATMLIGIRQAIQTHISRENAGGVLEQAVARLPRLAGEASDVERENSAMLRRVGSVIALLELAYQCPEYRPIVHPAVEELAVQILDQGGAELRLVQQGFNEDTIAID